MTEVYDIICTECGETIFVDKVDLRRGYILCSECGEKNIVYETECSNCGETVCVDKYDVITEFAICPECNESNFVFLINCPECGEDFVFNDLSELYCGTVECRFCGCECKLDREIIDKCLPPIPLEDEDYDLEGEEYPLSGEYTEDYDEDYDEDDTDYSDEDGVDSHHHAPLNSMLQSMAYEYIELTMDNYEIDDHSMGLVGILIYGKLRSTLPKDQCYQYLLKALYDYYAENADEKIEICYKDAIDIMVHYFSSRVEIEAIKNEIVGLTIELAVDIFYDVIKAELDYQKAGISPFKTLKIAGAVKKFKRNIKNDPVLCAKKSIISTVDEQTDLIFEKYSDILNVSDNAQGDTDHTSAKSSESSSQPQTTTNNEEQYSDPIEELNSLIGLGSVKKSIIELQSFVKIQKLRESRGLPSSNISHHLVFTGNPGTGKTTVARLVGRIYKDLGLITKEVPVEVSAKDLIAGYTGQTAIKTGEVIKEALGGVLFIDEAYTLVDGNDGGFGQQAIDTLLKEMEDHRDDLVVIVAGYSEPMEKFIRSNPGLKSRFNRFVHFEDYTPDELFEIFKSICEKNAYTTNSDADEIIKEYLAEVSKISGDDFANGRTVRNLFETIIAKQATRISAETDLSVEMLSTITEADVAWCLESTSQTESLEDILAELNSLIGLGMVKEEVADLVHVVEHQERRKAQGLRVPPMSMHLVFMGNPGTGKTTVARYIARLYKALGLLSKVQLVETDRSGLVAGYIGQTAIKTQEVIDEAMGGVLFIDEAYTLNGNSDNDFGQEAIDTLLKAMEDKRDDFAVIVAGYPDLMDEFVQSNPGLESRFNRYIHFEDYSADEMLSIFKMSCQKNQYTLTEAAEEAVKKYFSTVSISDIANGRGARNLFEKVVTQQAKRTVAISESKADELSTITEDDVINAME